LQAIWLLITTYETAVEGCISFKRRTCYVEDSLSVDVPQVASEKLVASVLKDPVHCKNTIFTG